LADRVLTLRDAICKNGNGYSVPLTRQAAKDLRALLAIRKSMGHAHDADAPLVVSRNHRGLSVRSYQDRLQHWRELAGLPVGVSPHWFRHTLAKRIMANSTAADPRGKVFVALGHGDINSTAIYTMPDKEDVRLALEQAM
jgi:site-specific recombinase XerC